MILRSQLACPNPRLLVTLLCQMAAGKRSDSSHALFARPRSGTIGLHPGLGTGRDSSNTVHHQATTDYQ